MSGVTKAINDELYNRVEEALSECSRSSDVSRKLQAIKSAKEYGITHIAKVFNTSRVSIMKWIKDFSEMGVDGLKLKPGRGRKRIVNEEERSLIAEWIQKDSGITIKALRLKIKSELGKEVGQTATHEIMMRLGYSYITPRPSHYKKKAESQSEFKKKSARRGAVKEK
jgi:transposase